MKPLPKSQRHSNRYVLCQIVSEQKVAKAQVVKEFETQAKALLGQIVYQKAACKQVSKITGLEQTQFVLQCVSTYAAHIRSVLPFIRSVQGVPVHCKSLRVSGSLLTIKQLIEKKQIGESICKH
ncbi:MAG: Rpp14/Pop5 family protein [Candidatus Woesearchaeota archaeon]